MNRRCNKKLVSAAVVESSVLARIIGEWLQTEARYLA
jgi:hypothetical protein